MDLGPAANRGDQKQIDQPRNGGARSRAADADFAGQQCGDGRDIAATDRIGGDVKRAGKQAHEWLGNLEVVMGQVGHAHPDTTLRIYAKVLNRDRSALGLAFDALMEGAVPAAGSDARAGFGQTIGQTTAETELDRLRAVWETRRNRLR